MVLGGQNQDFDGFGSFCGKKGVHIGVKPLYTWGVLAKKVTFFDIFGSKSRTFGGLGGTFCDKKCLVWGTLWANVPLEWW